jgi:large subunit ribosomal protein L24
MTQTGTKRVKVKKGDQVVVMAGKDRGKRGRVLDVKPREGKVKVEGVGVIKRHQRPNPGANRPGGIIEKEAYVDISNVQLIDPASGKPTRVRYDVGADGSKARVASGSGQSLDRE